MAQGYWSRVCTTTLHRPVWKGHGERHPETHVQMDGASGSSLELLCKAVLPLTRASISISLASHQAEIAKREGNEREHKPFWLMLALTAIMAELLAALSNGVLG